jgi:hypothetical protein
MKPLGRVIVGVGHAVALLVAAVIGGTTPWLRKKLQKEDDEVGRLI